MRLALKKGLICIVAVSSLDVRQEVMELQQQRHEGSQNLLSDSGMHSLHVKKGVICAQVKAHMNCYQFQFGCDADS